MRSAIIGYLRRRWGATEVVESGVLPVIGTKEFVALLPTLLAVGRGQRVVIPTTAYPTYDVGARIAFERMTWSAEKFSARYPRISTRSAA